LVNIITFGLAQRHHIHKAASTVFLFLAMFSSTTYANMFRELLENVYVDGVITRDWCEVPIQKWHVLQVSILTFLGLVAKHVLRHAVAF